MPTAPSLDAGRTACAAPAPLSTTGPNVLLIGDRCVAPLAQAAALALRLRPDHALCLTLWLSCSISMGSSGYSLFVQDMMQTSTGGALASIQHGGGFGGGGQMASSANGVAKVNACMGNATGTLKPHAWSVITYNAGLHDCDTPERVLPDACAPASVFAHRSCVAPVFGRLLPPSSASSSAPSSSAASASAPSAPASPSSPSSRPSAPGLLSVLHLAHQSAFCSRLARPQTAPTSKASSRR